MALENPPDAKMFLNTPPDQLLTVIREVFLIDPSPNATNNAHVALSMVDGADVSARVEWKVPPDFVSLVEVRAIVSPGGAGNLYWRPEASYGGLGESPIVHNEVGTYIETPVTNGILSYITLNLNEVLMNLSIGDLVGIRFRRDSTNVLDTVNASVGFYGLSIKYVSKLTKGF